jgi:hypothetical protein
LQGLENGEGDEQSAKSGGHRHGDTMAANVFSRTVSGAGGTRDDRPVLQITLEVRREFRGRAVACGRGLSPRPSW